MDVSEQASENSPVNGNFAFDSLQAIRNRLLDLTARNRLLNFKHGKSGFIRVIDEMPDQLAKNILQGDSFTFIPINEPKREQLIDNGFIAINDDGTEVRVKQDPKANEWAKILGFDTSYELPPSRKSDDQKHNDTNIQSLLYPRELEAQLRKIRSKANTAIEETGANILYLAFGFLEWFEDDNSSVQRQAPLYLIPVKIDKASLNKDSGTYTYSIEYTGEDIISNLSLREKLKHDFHLELPELSEDTLPDDYMKSVASHLIKHKRGWKVKRNATLAMFDFGKLLMYLDLDPSRWPEGAKNIQNHAILQKFFASEGVEDEGESTSSFASEYEIDSLDNVHTLYPLIDDADSSQHSALVDAIEGKNLVIEGPPGSGKSQTITNLIAAAIAQGKKVLFVAEKMAALQVVKSRLDRAGLGDFCLELHSHKTQKKQIYSNIAQRLEKQDEFRYPSSIDIDIQMYEEKKSALSDYAELINSQWKSTGKTIHQIFSTATRFREQFLDIKIDDIRPEHIDGHTFDEVSARRTSDELRRYADTFEQVKFQISENAELSDHPWFGVYNRELQLFDNDEVCDLLAEWNTSLNTLIVSLESVGEQFRTIHIENEDTLTEVFEDVSNLPEILGNEYIPALRNITLHQRNSVVEFIEKYRVSYSVFTELKTFFALDALKEGENLEQLNRSIIEIQKFCKNHHLVLSDLYKRLEDIRSLDELITSIDEDVRTITAQDFSLTEVLFLSADSLKNLQTYLTFITSLDTSLIHRRNELFDNDLLDEHISELRNIIVDIQPLHESLKESFNLEALPAQAEIVGLRQVMESTWFLSFLSSEWRSAKAQLTSFAVSKKTNMKLLISKLGDLISYQALKAKLESEPMYRSLLKSEYKGINTPINDIISLRDWYKGVRDNFGIGFGKNVVFAKSLFSTSDEVFKGLKYLANTKTSVELENYFLLREQLTGSLKHVTLTNNDLILDDTDSFNELAISLALHLKNIQSLCKKDMTVSEVSAKSQEITSFLEAERALARNSIVDDLFDGTFTLTPREHSDEALSAVRSTVALAISIDALQSEQLKSYLLSNVSQEVIEQLKVKIQDSHEMYSSQVRAFSKFSDKVDLDKQAWFFGTEGNFGSYIARNTKALTQPRWLTTWVDFVRIRTSLSDKGLEKLLRYTESDVIDLSNIENIYKFSVFDVLAKEIISEEQKLAHFSGSDQNAIANQFRDYDNKLKSLQREKIAYKVAKDNYSQIRSGVSYGKVASYTEMGLINNEVNKKTRHVPVRQLVKRAGHSLVAIKPCFMMGPNSVAQYLEPGQIEFDIVIMDEASQIKPEDALGTIARGKQLVVVGDPKQLPPTSFFDKTVVSEEEDVTAIEQSESILDVSLPMFNARRLRWHYRSRHESLIAFSNQQFYSSNLVVFPSPTSVSEEFGIKFTYVKNGRFVNQHNIEEAKLIALAVRSHLTHRPNESLGVVAMSSKQREQIERCVEDLSKDDSEFRDALSENVHKDEPLFMKNLENVQGDERDVIYISCTYGPQEAGAAQMPQRFGPINSASGGRRLNVLFTRSKKRMHVFSSMTEGHILASQTSSPGVHALKGFLGYAESGNLHQAQYTGKQPDSDFEISVIEALKIQGFNCVAQVGVGGYFIDLAVQDPGQPGRYLMGIECDGATYHSAKSARDRDRLRQSVLESLGWNIKRIWSTDWFKNPQAQLNPIIEELHKLKSEYVPVNTHESEVDDIEEVVAQEEANFSKIESFSHAQGSLYEKLIKFGQYMKTSGANESVSSANRLLRPAMIDALCEYRPMSKSEFLEVIPQYLRSATSPKEAKYLDPVFNIIAESEGNQAN